MPQVFVVLFKDYRGDFGKVRNPFKFLSASDQQQISIYIYQYIESRTEYYGHIKEIKILQ